LIEIESIPRRDPIVFSFPVHSGPRKLALSFFRPKRRIGLLARGTALAIAGIQTNVCFALCSPPLELPPLGLSKEAVVKQKFFE
jgi:hypothetical protein